MPFVAHSASIDPAGCQNLKRRSVRGAAVTGGAQVMKLIIRLGGTAILARLLSPADYGMVAMTTVITGFVGMFTDAGLASATVQRPQISHGEVSTLFWINAILGLVLAGVVASISPAVAWFYDTPQLTPVCAAIALTFLFAGLTVQHQALLRREMRFKLLAITEVVAMLAGIGVAIAMAVGGFGYWSLVGMQVATAATQALCVWLALDWRPGRPEELRSHLPLLRFGGDVLAFNVVNYFARQADNLLIGWYWGASALGLYDKAYALLLLPIKQINGPLGAVAMPALARMQSQPAQFSRFFLSGVQLVASVCVPLVVLVALFADEIVRLWLGPDWSECAHLFRLLSVAAGLGAIGNPVGWYLVALGHTRRYRQLGFRNSAAIVAGFAIGLPYGAEGVALAYSITTVLLFLPTWWFVLRGTPTSLPRFLISLIPPLGATLPAAGVAFAIKRLVMPHGPEWITELLAASAFGLVYALVLLVGFRRWSFFRGILSQLRP